MTTTGPAPALPGTREWRLGLPAWIHDVDAGRTYPSDEDKVALAIELSRLNVEAASGGPFGAAVFGPGDRLLAVGVNRVLPQACSVAHAETMAVIADADVLVQSSNGFETQGMTVTEALALGTRVVVVDSDIAGDLPDGSYSLTNDLSDHEMARVLDDCARSNRNRHRDHIDAFRAQFRQSSRTAEMLALYSSLR